MKLPDNILKTPGSSRSSGQELIEYALILPVLLALLLGMMELGVAVFNYNTMSNAAREAARKGVVTRNEPAIKTAGLRLTSATPLTTTNFTITWLPITGNTPVADINLAKRVRVRVTRTYQLMTGSFLRAFGFRATLPMTATATMNLE